MQWCKGYKNVPNLCSFASSAGRALSRLPYKVVTTIVSSEELSNHSIFRVPQRDRGTSALFSGKNYFLTFFDDKAFSPEEPGYLLVRCGRKYVPNVVNRLQCCFFSPRSVPVEACHRSPGCSSFCLDDVRFSGRWLSLRHRRKTGRAPLKLVSTYTTYCFIAYAVQHAQTAHSTIPSAEFSLAPAAPAAAVAAKQYIARRMPFP